MTNDELNQEAIKRWPHLPMEKAKQRHRARAKVKAAMKIEALEEEGACCRKCLFHIGLPSSLSHSPSYKEKTCCDYHSDGGAYQITTPDSLCGDFRPKTPPTKDP